MIIVVYIYVYGGDVWVFGCVGVWVSMYVKQRDAGNGGEMLWCRSGDVGDKIVRPMCAKHCFSWYGMEYK